MIAITTGKDYPFIIKIIILLLGTIFFIYVAIFDPSPRTISDTKTVVGIVGDRISIPKSENAYSFKFISENKKEMKFNIQDSIFNEYYYDTYNLGNKIYSKFITGKKVKIWYLKSALPFTNTFKAYQIEILDGNLSSDKRYFCYFIGGNSKKFTHIFLAIFSLMCLIYVMLKGAKNE